MNRNTPLSGFSRNPDAGIPRALIEEIMSYFEGAEREGTREMLENLGPSAGVVDISEETSTTFLMRRGMGTLSQTERASAEHESHLRGPTRCHNVHHSSPEECLKSIVTRDEALRTMFMFTLRELVEEGASALGRKVAGERYGQYNTILKRVLGHKEKEGVSSVCQLLLSSLIDEESVPLIVKAYWYIMIGDGNHAEAHSSFYAHDEGLVFDAFGRAGCFMIRKGRIALFGSLGEVEPVGVGAAPVRGQATGNASVGGNASYWFEIDHRFYQYYVNHRIVEKLIEDCFPIVEDALFPYA